MSTKRKAHHIIAMLLTPSMAAALCPLTAFAETVISSITVTGVLMPAEGEKPSKNMRTICAISTVSDNQIPDVKVTNAYTKEIHTFYPAGILAKNNAVGAFASNNNIKRSRAVAILMRIIKISARKNIALK